MLLLLLWQHKRKEKKDFRSFFLRFEGRRKRDIQVYSSSSRFRYKSFRAAREEVAPPPSFLSEMQRRRWWLPRHAMHRLRSTVHKAPRRLRQPLPHLFSASSSSECLAPNPSFPPPSRTKMISPCSFLSGWAWAINSSRSAIARKVLFRKRPLPLPSPSPPGNVNQDYARGDDLYPIIILPFTFFLDFNSILFLPFSGEILSFGH